MSIIAQYRTEVVEVVDVWTTGDGRRVAEIATIDGTTPWTAYSSTGGPCPSSSKTVPASLLHPVDDCNCNPNTVMACDACKLALAVGQIGQVYNG